MRSGCGRSRRMLPWILIAALLLAPLVAMRFTSEVQWTGFDFAVASALLIGGLGSYELARLFIHDRRQRVMMGGALLTLVLLVWAEGAVGIF